MKVFLAMETDTDASSVLGVFKTRKGAEKHLRERATALMDRRTKSWKLNRPDDDRDIVTEIWFKSYNGWRKSSTYWVNEVEVQDEEGGEDEVHRARRLT